MDDRMRDVSQADTPNRRERAAIAAQACQTCRTRKSKCDEQRPRCSLCRRLDVECHYREPLPTKKDKTMTHILDTLTRLEAKFDNVALSSPGAQARSSASKPTEAASSMPNMPVIGTNDRSFTDAQAVFTWPAVYVYLIGTNIPAAADLPDILQRGSAWFMQLQTDRRTQIPDPDLTLESLLRPAGSGFPGITFPRLSVQQTQVYAEAYFHTFNVVSPVLDQDTFLSDVIAPVTRHNYRSGDTKAVIALLVFALGQLAMEGTLDDPVVAAHHGRSGIRGGTPINPPGLAIFNEARKRMGLLLADFSIEDIQMRLLAARYLDAISMPFEFWRMTMTASASCELLIKTSSIEWHSACGNGLQRLYWICWLNEAMCISYLDTPHSSLIRLQDEIPLLTYCDESGKSGRRLLENVQAQHEHFFPAIISLERIVQDIHKSILAPTAQQAQTAAGMVGPSMGVIREMARQLEAWRSMLPRSLQWRDNEMFEFPETEIDMRRPSEPIFAVDQGAVPIRHHFNLDITTAHLRSRFYLARHLLHMPFLYKVLNFPELLDQDDIDCASQSLRSALTWPALMAPPKDKKRLMPYLFTWTQSCASVLLVLKMTQVNEQLKSICEGHVDPASVQSTVSIMLDWIRDVQLVDPFAAWALQLLEPLYSNDN